MFRLFTLEAAHDLLDITLVDEAGRRLKYERPAVSTCQVMGGEGTYLYEPDPDWFRIERSEGTHSETASNLSNLLAMASNPRAMASNLIIAIFNFMIAL